MLARESGDIIETTNQVSVLELALRLASEWRIVLAGAIVGLLVSTAVYLGSQPGYTCSMMILVGHEYGEHAPTPLEPPFLAGRRIQMQFGGNSGETIKTKVYESDFDLRKRRTLEISITTGSPERSQALAGQIAEFLLRDHERLYQEAVTRAKKAEQHAKKKLAIEEQVIPLYRKLNREWYRKELEHKLDGADAMFVGEMWRFANAQIQNHQIKVNNYKNVIERTRPKSTTIPLMPDRGAIFASMPSLNILLSGVFAGLFFGIVAAVFAQTWRSTRARAISGKVS